jgi:multidrug efflux pump subunit AcrA (membrane-fusion protein)
MDRWIGVIVLLVPMMATMVRPTVCRMGIGTRSTANRSTPYLPSPNSRIVGFGVVESCNGNIAVDTPVPGIVSQIFVEVGQKVQVGAPLYCMDDRQFQATRKVRESALRAVEAELARLESMPRRESLPAAEAKIREAKATLAAKQDQFDRCASLRPYHVIAEEEYVMDKLGCEAARQRVIGLEAEYALLRAGAWEPDKAMARAAVARAKAELKQTQTDLDLSLVRAPIGGVVLQVNTHPGEFVGLTSQPAVPVPPPVVLGDVDTLHVRVEIDGQDIPRFRPDGFAHATPHAHSHPEYPLDFVRVLPCVIPKRLSAVSGPSGGIELRVLQVIYSLRPGNHALYVGQQLDISIDLSASDVDSE